MASPWGDLKSMGKLAYVTFLVLGALVSLFSLSCPQTQMLFQIHPTFPSKQMYPYTTNHLWTTESFPILRPQIAQLFQTKPI